MRKTRNKNAFTLIELLAVIVILGVIITLAIPVLRNLTYNSADKEYQYHMKLVHEATKLYAKNYRGELRNDDSDCFNLPYQTLIQEQLIEEENISCTGSIILERRSNSGYNYKYYLNCQDASGKVLHESEPIPLACKGVSGKFKIDYALYKDGNSGQIPYKEGDWERFVYGEYTASSPYNYPIEGTEYSVDFINWNPMSNQKQTYTNYNGNVFARAVDTGGNVSEPIRHLVRADSMGPSFVIHSDENTIQENDIITISIGDIQDRGVGVNLEEKIYSLDGNTWTKTLAYDFKVATETSVYVKDRLGNITTQPLSIVRACSGGGATATANDIRKGKTAWIDGVKVTGTMEENKIPSKVLNFGDTYMIPAGYHDGTEQITVGGLDNHTPGTATANTIVSGRTAWVNGKKITGTMADRGQLNWRPTNGTTYTIPSGYYSGGVIDSTAAYESGYQEGKRNTTSGIIMTNLNAHASSGNGQGDTASFMDYTFDVSGYNRIKLTGITQYYNRESHFIIKADGNEVYSGSKDSGVSWDYVLDISGYSSIEIDAYCNDSTNQTASEIKTLITKLEIYNE